MSNEIELTSAQDNFLQWVYVHNYLHKGEIKSDSTLSRLIIQTSASMCYYPKDKDMLNTIRDTYIKDYLKRNG